MRDPWTEELVTPDSVEEQNIVIRMTLCWSACMCPHAYLKYHRSDLPQIFAHVTYGCGLVLLWWQCNTLWNSLPPSIVNFSLLAHLEIP